jgi:glycosyltransferase involved in cell wall biosynthesis
MAPKVTVTLLTYKSNLQFLAKALESILSQSYKDFELLIIDDGPKEHNTPVVEKYQKKDKRVRIIKNKKRAGRLKSRNLGLREARGKYIAILDSDDFWCDKDKLKKQVGFLEKNPDYGAIGTAMVLINVKGKELGRIKYPLSDEKIRRFMLSSFQMAHPSVVFRKSLTRKIGLYSESRILKYAEDYEFFLRAGQFCKLANLPDYCLKYRVHPGSGTEKNQFKQRLTVIFLTARYFGKYPGGVSAALKKMATLFLPRKTMDRLIRSKKKFAKIYSGFTGIKKQL